MAQSASDSTNNKITFIRLCSFHLKWLAIGTTLLKLKVRLKAFQVWQVICLKVPCGVLAASIAMVQCFLKVGPCCVCAHTHPQKHTDDRLLIPANVSYYSTDLQVAVTCRETQQCARKCKLASN